MSNTIQIKIIDVEIQKAITIKNKPYEFLEVSYKNQSFQDKPEVKKIMPFGDKTVFDILRAAKKGDIFTVTREKNDAGFWDWNIISTGEQSVTEPQKTTPTKGTWETVEERALKQLYIIKQSCLAQAVNTEAIGTKPGTPVNINNILSLAQTYVDFICNTTSKDLNEDIPY